MIRVTGLPAGTGVQRRTKAVEELRAHWDKDAETYELWPEHRARTEAERAAWAAVLRRLLPGEGGRVLDVGAGTGVLSLPAARLGYRVTGVDVSPSMLARLQASADREGLSIETICTPADEPPPGPFDAVMERLLLWTLPEPEGALRAWRRVAPDAELLAFEGLWGVRDLAQGLRRRARELLRILRRLPPEHQGQYSLDLEATLPLLRGGPPSVYIAAIERAGWEGPRLERLRDVEWTRELALPPLDRFLGGVTPEYVLAARSR